MFPGESRTESDLWADFKIEPLKPGFFWAHATSIGSTLKEVKIAQICGLPPKRFEQLIKNAKSAKKLLADAQPFSMARH